MRVGIVCEGKTDALAIEYFVRESMKSRGHDLVFVRLQPDPDRTYAGGWVLALEWLRSNPPKSRVAGYLNGLFRDGLTEKRCDAIVLHLDADVLSEESFRNYMKKHFDLAVKDSDDTIGRGKQIVEVLQVVGGFSELNFVDLQRHVTAPAVEAGETWHIGAFEKVPGEDIERLRGTSLRDRFMTVLHRSEGRDVQSSYTTTSKAVRRRRRFLKTHAKRCLTLERNCHHYKALVDKLLFVV